MQIIKILYRLSLVIFGLMMLYVASKIVINNTVNYSYTATEPIQFVGTYSIDGGPELPLTDYEIFHDYKVHTVVFKGHFSKSIPKNEKLILHLSNIRVQLAVNGEEVYSFGKKRHDNIFDSPGMAWDTLQSNGILTTDEIEITIENIYPKLGTPVYSYFFEHLQIGDFYDFAQQLLSKYKVELLIGVTIILVGIGLFLYSFIRYFCKRKCVNRLIALSVLIYSCGHYIIITGGFDVIPILIKNPAYANLVTLLSVYVLPFSFGIVLTYYAQGLSSVIFRLWTFFYTIFLSTILIFQFMGYMDLGYSLPVF